MTAAKVQIRIEKCEILSCFSLVGEEFNQGLRNTWTGGTYERLNSKYKWAVTLDG